MFRFLKNFDTLESDEVLLRLSEKHRGNAELLPFYYYDIYRKDTDVPIGKISLRIGENAHSDYNGHIGYEIDAPHRGNHFSYFACLALLPLARAHGMTQLLLTCAESNAASRRIIERLGAELLEIVPISKSCFFWREGIEDYCIYRLNLS